MNDAARNRLERVAKIRRESGLSRGFARGSAYATWGANARKGESNAHPESDAADMLAYLRGLRGEQP